MTYRELYEKAFTDFEFGNITLEEFEERVKPLNQEPASVIEELENLVEVMKKKNQASRSYRQLVYGRYNNDKHS